MLAQRAGARPLPKKRPAKTIPAASASRWFPLTSESSRFRATKSPCRYTARNSRSRKAGSRHASLPPSAWKSHVNVRMRIAASIGLAQLTLAPYGFASIHSSSVSRTTCACSSSPSSRYAWPAGSSHCRREISQGTFTSLGRSSCAYSRSRHHAGGQVVPETTSVCQSAGRSSRNGPVPSRSRVRSAARAAPACTRSRSPGATRSSSSASIRGSRNGRLRRRSQQEASVSSPSAANNARSSSRLALDGPRNRSVLTVASAHPRRSTTRGGLVSALRASTNAWEATGATAKPPASGRWR